MILEGYVTDKNKCPMPSALVEVKNDRFQTLYSAMSDDAGHYQLDIPAGRYPFLTAVKDYAVHYLEYWCQNISLESPMKLDVSFDQLEIYGLHAFTVKGGGNSLMVYFRPMSLSKFLQRMSDIVPDGMNITVLLDGEEAPVLHANYVQEMAGDTAMTACLIQVDASAKATPWHQLEVRVVDAEQHYGAASIFRMEE